MIPKVTPFDAYKSYLGLKNHFTREKYDYHRYCGKSRATIQSFYKRKDRFFFEKLSRQKDDSEVVEFFVSNFVSCDDPQSLWIGEIVRNGEQNYTDWKKRLQSLTYTFKTEVENVFTGKGFDAMFRVRGKIGMTNVVFHDTIALISAIYKDPFKFQEKIILVETDEKRGETVEHFQGNKILVAVDFNKEWFKNYLIKILK